jgi:hypothetical protein
VRAAPDVRAAAAGGHAGAGRPTVRAAAAAASRVVLAESKRIGNSQRTVFEKWRRRPQQQYLPSSKHNHQN